MDTRINTALLWVAISLGSILALCALIFHQYAISDFFDYKSAVTTTGYNSLAFVILCIYALVIELPGSLYRRTLIVLWALISASTMLVSFPLTNPLFLGLDPFVLLIGSLSVYCTLLFGISVVVGYGTRRV